MSVENPLWGAPRIHGELLNLGFEVAQSTVAKYMIKWPRPRSQTWGRSCNHAPDIAAIDLFAVPTISFGPNRREILDPVTVLSAAHLRRIIAPGLGGLHHIYSRT
jgi:hypothetical protein